MVQSRSAAATRKVEQRKREILEAASTVFRRQGLHATGMRDIASEVDMHAGNIYYYFRDKQELLAYCQHEALSGLLALARSVTESSDGPAGKLRRLVVGHVVRLNEGTPGSLAHLEVEALDEPWRERLQDQRDQYEEMIRRILRAGTDQGEFREMDVPVTGRAILGALNWTVKWFRPEGSLTAAQIGEQFADIFLNGIRRAGTDVDSEARR